MNEKMLLCQCGCGLKASNDTIWWLKSIERFIQGYEPNLKEYQLNIRSTARCPTHNKKVGGNENSAHIIQLAADIGFENNYIKYLILEHLMTLQTGRIGISNKSKFIHFDTAKNKDLPYPTETLTKYPSPRLWHY